MKSYSTAPEALLNLTYFKGRVALYAILKALGIGRGENVAIQGFTCLAVPEAIMATGAKPVYVDLEPDGVNMDPGDLAMKITPRTRALVVQHTFGIPADMDRICKVAEAYQVPIVEDCCHTLLSHYKGRVVGRFGVASFYSFEWGKPIIAGVGGAAIINDNNLRRIMQEQYANYSRPPLQVEVKAWLLYMIHRSIYHPSLYWPMRSLYHNLASCGLVDDGFNYDLINPSITKGFGYKIPRSTGKRLASKLRGLMQYSRHNAWLSTEFRTGINSPPVSHLPISWEVPPVLVRFPLLARQKQELLKQARRARIELAGWFESPVHPLREDQYHLVHYSKNFCPHAESLSERIVTLPMNLKLDKKMVAHIINFFQDKAVA